MGKSRDFTKHDVEAAATPAFEGSGDTIEINPGSTGPFYTGRKIVIYREPKAFESGLRQVARLTGLKMVAVASDYGEQGVDLAEAASADAVHFNHLGVSVFSGDPDRLGRLVGLAGGDSEILEVLPERLVFLAGDVPQPPMTTVTVGSTVEYLRGFQQGLGFALDRLGAGIGPVGFELADGSAELASFAFSDTQGATWGLQATGVLDADGKALTKWTGKGVRVAVIDSGIDLNHPHLKGKVAGRFPAVMGENSVQDSNGHGTHVAGTIAGAKGYGVAPDAELYVAKVFPGGGKTTDQRTVIAGIDWAITNKCQIANLSLAGPMQPGQAPHADYAQIGERALKQGTLLVAAAGNDSMRPHSIRPVGEPANAPKIIAVSGIDAAGAMYVRSNARRGGVDGGDIDFTAPGVRVFSAWPIQLSQVGADRLDGTSMATPHVAGIAALFSESRKGAGGETLWKLMSVTATRKGLPFGGEDIGHGLVKAPT